MQIREAGLRYRLQVVAFKWTVAGEVAGARAEKRLRGMAAKTGIMLFQKGGDVGRVADEVGGTLCATHTHRQ